MSKKERRKKRMRMDEIHLDVMSQIDGIDYLVEEAIPDADELLRPILVKRRTEMIDKVKVLTNEYKTLEEELAQ